MLIYSVLNSQKSLYFHHRRRFATDLYGQKLIRICSSPKMSNTPAAAPTSSSKSKAAGSSQAPEKRKPLFQKELQHMMYGFGDEQNPLPETVALVEDIVVEYVTDLTHKAQEIGTKRGRLLVDDFLYLIRKDLPKLNRCRELLAMQEELKQARKAFDVDEEKITSLD
ncbi:transcription initiation factor TFIID subunit 13 isoform X3 [Brassica napus]|uniref:transcription initiation factor TFIID subunit 13 isoform X3 n=1 Tax=Brassica napus TaxID=3708 RepID=UPI00207A2FCB|nr:transcription initiation factor TFIID subunit 13 isoform X3 [Brassica napus]